MIIYKNKPLQYFIEMQFNEKFCIIQSYTFMYAQVEPLKERPVKAPKRNKKIDETTKEDEVKNYCIEYSRRYTEILVK